MNSSARRAFWALATVAAGVVGLAPLHAQAATRTGPFNEVWTVALSQYDQASESGSSVTQLSNGTLLVAGNDAHIPNYCSTRRHPLLGGAWLVAVTPSGGNNVWQKLYSTCATAAQSADLVEHTADGGSVLGGGDFDNPACLDGCGWFAKLGSTGAISWQHDLIGADSAGASSLLPTSDGGYIAVGNESPTAAGILQGLIFKISAGGALQWTRAYPESATSFAGAYDGASFTFETVRPTNDGGYIASGVADAHFASGYATVLVVMKLDAAGAVQWSKAYYGTNWLSGPAGGSRYPIFPTADGGYVLSGTVQQPSYPFEELFFLMKLDAAGNVVWQKGYGGTNGYNHVSSESGGAYASADGGYVLAGESDIFNHAANGWMLKTDALGDITWQKTYTGLTTNGGNLFNDVIQTSDGGYAVTGESWTADPTYGGPGMWLITTDPAGAIGTCSCAQSTNVSPQAIDLTTFQAAFVETATGLSFGPVNIESKSTSVTPTSVYP